jgi:hypothetical protein
MKYFTHENMKQLKIMLESPASEDVFVKKYTIAHINSVTKSTLKFNAHSTPKYVAIPFPPLNFNQIGNMCPRTGAAMFSKLITSLSV